MSTDSFLSHIEARFQHLLFKRSLLLNLKALYEASWAKMLKKSYFATTGLHAKQKPQTTAVNRLCCRDGNEHLPHLGPKVHATVVNSTLQSDSSR